MLDAGAVQRRRHDADGEEMQMASMVVVERRRRGLRGLRRAFRQTAQGQWADPVVDEDVASFTKLMEFDLQLFPGQVGWVHRHRYVTPLVRMHRGGPVATLIGPQLEEVIWLERGGRASIDGQVPHLCVYPRRRIGGRVLPRWMQSTARGSETRNAKTLDEDTERLPELWPVAIARIAALGWDVTFPADMPEGLVVPPPRRLVPAA